MSLFFSSITEAFAELEVQWDAGFAACKKQFRLLSLKRHPDKVGGSKEAFQRLLDAWELVQNAELEDLSRRVREGGGGGFGSGDAGFGGGDGGMGKGEGAGGERDSDGNRGQNDGSNQGQFNQSMPENFQQNGENDDPQFYFRYMAQKRANDLNQNNKTGNQNRRQRATEPPADSASFVTSSRVLREAALSDFAAHYGIKERLCDFLSEALDREMGASSGEEEATGVASSTTTREEEQVLTFPVQFTNHDRKYVHLLAETLGLFTESIGCRKTGSRVVTVRLRPPQHLSNTNKGGLQSKKLGKRLVCSKNGEGCSSGRNGLEVGPITAGIDTTQPDLTQSSMTASTIGAIQPPPPPPPVPSDSHLIPASIASDVDSNLTITSGETINGTVATVSQLQPDPTENKPRCPFCQSEMITYEAFERARGRGGGYFDRQETMPSIQYDVFNSTNNKEKNEEYDDGDIDDFGRKRRRKEEVKAVGDGQTGIQIGIQTGSGSGDSAGGGGTDVAGEAADTAPKKKLTKAQMAQLRYSKKTSKKGLS